MAVDLVGPSGFMDRADAGRTLGAHLLRTGVKAELVLGVPPAGPVLADMVSRRLQLPLEALLVEGFDDPRQPGTVIGAIGEAGIRLIDADRARETQLPLTELGAAERRARVKLERRAHVLREGRARLPLTGLHVLIIDDDVVRALTASIGCLSASALGAASITVAAPFVALEEIPFVRGADRVIGLRQVDSGTLRRQLYERSETVTDADIARLLRAREGLSARAAPPRSA